MLDGLSCPTKGQSTCIAYPCYARLCGKPQHTIHYHSQSLCSHSKTAQGNLPRAVLYIALQNLTASKVGKGAVGLGHFVGVFLFLEGDTSLVARINDLCCQALTIWHTTLRSGSLH